MIPPKAEESLAASMTKAEVEPRTGRTFRISSHFVKTRYPLDELNPVPA
jgi:hypothetical protein